MRTHVDWITFTIPMIYWGDSADAYADAIAAGLTDMFGVDLRDKIFAGEWRKNEKSRAPYTDAWTLPDHAITVFASPTLTHACVEISGQGCEILHAQNTMYPLLQSCHRRATRIDIACDIETKTKPTEFVSKREHARMRTSGHVISDTGETCYVGSQKSDRYARVYRYNAPHPRSHLLRVEHVYRKDYAKRVAEVASSGDMEALALASGRAVGWQHGDWQPTISDPVDISVVHERGNAGNTVYWLVNSVAPAFKRLCETGAIVDPEAFIQAYFLT